MVKNEVKTAMRNALSAAPRQRLPVAELTVAAFAPFGQVIECAGRSSQAINAASSQRFNDLAQLEADADGRLALSIFQASARRAPFALDTLECHPLGSQAFVPLHGQSFLIVVASARPDPQRIEASALQVFVSQRGQGINFRRGVWHHPLLALCDGDFLVADRLGPGNNCEEIDITHWQLGIDR
ncbi:MAG: ureidoglycolate hydrolase [Proteobacteria bacterium]|nr:ureidoglycolate hydrolase [Pseudomonadota bacterium]